MKRAGNALREYNRLAQRRCRARRRELVRQADIAAGRLIVIPQPDGSFLEMAVRRVPQIEVLT